VNFGIHTNFVSFLFVVFIFFGPLCYVFLFIWLSNHNGHILEVFANFFFWCHILACFGKHMIKAFTLDKLSSKPKISQLTTYLRTIVITFKFVQSFLTYTTIFFLDPYSSNNGISFLPKFVLKFYLSQTNLLWYAFVVNQPPNFLSPKQNCHVFPLTSIS